MHPRIHLPRRHLMALAAAATLAASFTVVPSAGLAAEALPPVADYVRYPDFSSPVLSPNGKFLAMQVPIEDRLSLAVVDLEGKSTKVLTNIPNQDVVNINWVGNEHLVFSVGRQNSPTGAYTPRRGGGLFMVARDGSLSRVLSSPDPAAPGPAVSLVRTLSDSAEDIIVAGRLRSRESSDLYRMNVKSGRLTLLTQERPARVMGWVLDHQQVARVAFSRDEDDASLGSTIYYRKGADAPWTVLHRAKGSPDEDIFRPLAIDPSDNTTLYVASNRGRDTVAIFKFDPNTQTLGELVAGHARYDLGVDASGQMVPGLIRQPKSGEVLGFAIDGDKRSTAWTSEAMARLQAMLDKALPGRVNTIGTTETSRYLVTSYSDQSAPEYFIYDDQARKLEFVASGMPWLKPSQLVEQRPFLLRTRDGLEIPSYYFLPANHQAGVKLPTVIHIHGGPMARADRWGPTWAGGFGVSEAQLLASRGYAVILPNFRVTPGFGRKIYSAGFNTVGRQMSEDHEDAVKWGISQGYTDASRVCISGASYGGYAALRALAKTPEMFKCAVAGLSVSDMALQLRSTSGDTAYNDAGVSYWRRLLGEDVQPGIAKLVSPVNQADQIKGKVFMYAGADDVRTPLEQTTRMADALRAAGNPPAEVLVKPEEGHGFGRLNNRVELAEKMLKFLDGQIGPSSQR